MNNDMDMVKFIKQKICHANAIVTGCTLDVC